MKYQIIATRDIVSNLYSIPMFVASIGGAIRGFGDACSSQNDVIGQHPEDFELIHLGEYNDETGDFSVHGNGGEGPKQIAVGANYRKTRETK